MQPTESRKDTVELNPLSQRDLIDVYRPLHPRTHIFSGSHRIFISTDHFQAIKHAPTNSKQWGDTEPALGAHSIKPVPGNS